VLCNLQSTIPRCCGRATLGVTFPASPAVGGSPEGGQTIRPKLDIPALLCLMGATVCWGSVPVMLGYLADPHLIPDGYTANAVRYPLSALVYLPWLVRAIRGGGLGRFWLTALIPTAVNVAGQTLWGLSPYYLPPGQFAFLFRLSALFGILGAFWVFPDERRLARNVMFWVGACLAVLGFGALAALILTGGHHIRPAGIVIIFVCSLCYGAYGVSVRYVMGKLDPLVVFAVICAYTSIPLLAMAPLGDPTSLLRLGAMPMTILVISGLLGVAVAHGLYYVAVQRLGVAVTSLTLTATPVVSVIGSCLWLGERFTVWQWMSGAVLVAGTAVALWSHQHLPVAPTDEGIAETAGQP
jgi:drug/metabolite transporter (DMT)-like permease